MATVGVGDALPAEAAQAPAEIGKIRDRSGRAGGGRRGAAVGLRDLHRSRRPHADQSHQQRGGHPSRGECARGPVAARHHRARGLAHPPGAAAREGGGTPPCPDRRAVLGHCRAAGDSRRGRRERDARSRPRPAVLGARPLDDGELAHRRGRLCARACPVDSRRRRCDGDRRDARQAAVRPGPRTVPPVLHRAGLAARPADRDDDHRRRHGRSSRPTSSYPRSCKPPARAAAGYAGQGGGGRCRRSASSTTRTTSAR